jgi:HPt (histidine-containing phosphotransfer) domain-containing protein
METIDDADAGRPVLDVARLRDLLGDDAELVADVIQLYLDDYPQRLDAMVRAIQARDFARLRAEAHALKGSASTLAGGRVADAAHELEAVAETGDIARAGRSLASLASAAAQLAAALRELQAARL